MFEPGFTAGRHGEVILCRKRLNVVNCFKRDGYEMLEQSQNGELDGLNMQKVVLVDCL